MQGVKATIKLERIEPRILDCEDDVQTSIRQRHGVEFTRSYWCIKLSFSLPVQKKKKGLSAEKLLEKLLENPAGKKLPGREARTFRARGCRSNRFAILVLHKFLGDNFLYLNSINFLPANISANLIPLLG